jgi:hypothetical protein
MGEGDSSNGKGRKDDASKFKESQSKRILFGLGVVSQEIILHESETQP